MTNHAEIEQQRALVRSRPADLGPLLDLALMLYRAGELGEASVLGDRLLQRAPNHPGVLWLGARLALDRGEPDRARSLLEAVLSVAGLSAMQRSESLLLYGDALDALGHLREAFAAAAQGKAILHREFAPAARGRESEAVRYRRLTSWFGRPGEGAWPACAESSPLPSGPACHVFILGFPRSGTTLLEQVLAGHPDVEALEEAPTFAAHQQAFLADDAGCARLAALSELEAAQWRARYWDEARRRGATLARPVFVDKAPAGTLYLPLIARLFPRAKILFALRDPRDVVLSCFRSAFQMNAMTYAFTTLAGAADCYGACMAMAAVYRERLPLDLREVRHEAFVTDPVGELAAIAGFLGIEVDPAMLDIRGTMAGRTVLTPSAPQLREGINVRRLARWRGYAEALAPVMPTLEPWIARLGYADPG